MDKWFEPAKRKTFEQFWVAEKNDQIIGYARAILCGDLRELTEFFVQPGIQASGVGRELLDRAFPAEGARRRCIIATIDPSAQALYLQAKIYPRFPIYSFGRVVGYGYIGKSSGPVAVLDDQDFPAVLAHAETTAAAAEHKKLHLIVPLINTKAVDTLLGRGFRLDRFFCQVMTDQPFGQFENYISTSPMFFL